MGTLAQLTALRSQLAIGLAAYLVGVETLALRIASPRGVLGRRSLADTTDQRTSETRAGLFVWPDVIARHSLDQTTRDRRRLADERGEFGADDEPFTRTPWLTVLEHAGTVRRLVVLGRPGQGKTTLGALTCHRIAGKGLAVLHARSRPLAGVPVPILLRVADVVDAGSFEEAIRQAVRRTIDGSGIDVPPGAPARATAFVVARLSSPDTVLWLDALDEGGETGGEDLDPRDALADLHRLTGCVTVVSGRTHRYDSLSPIARDWDAHEYEIAALSPDQKQAFIERWFHGGQGATQQQLIDLATRGGPVADLAGSPLLLTLMCATADVPANAAVTRVELLEAMVEHRIRHLHPGRPQLTGPAIDHRLDRLARTVSMLFSPSPGARHFSYADWKGAAMAAGAAPEEASDDLTCYHRVGLIVSRSRGRYQFLHPVFQQFLLARALSAESHDDVAGAIVERAGLEAWRETLSLTIGLLARIACHGSGTLAAVVEALVDGGEESNPGLAIVAEAVGEAPAAAPPSALITRIQTRLLDTMTADSTQSVVVRRATGTALGVLGDPRFRPDLFHLPHDEWLGLTYVPPEVFRMGSSADWALDDERPEHDVRLSGFYVARFPVTVAQFGAFVEEGYRPAVSLWRQRPANHPVTYVSWDDAVAFCRWLTERLTRSPRTPSSNRALLLDSQSRWAFALPTEGQWERAARGPRGLRFPWGPDPDARRANCAELGLRTTTPVGCFPGGAAEAAEDLCGNVWEWTRSEERRYPCEPGDGRDDERRGGQRILRGGAFNHRLTHAGYRASGAQPFRNGAVGFRLVLTDLSIEDDARSGRA